MSDPLRKLREGLADGSIKVWCYCDEYDGPEPESWVPPDDWHADVCVLDRMRSS